MQVTIKFQKLGATVTLWQPNKRYFVGDGVLRKGHLYECRLLHTSSSSFKDDSLIRHVWIFKAKRP
jgi:hypothetical protein